MSAHGAIVKAAAAVVQAPCTPATNDLMIWIFVSGIAAIWVAAIAVAVLVVKTRKVSRESEESWRELKEQFSELKTLSQVRPLR